MSKKKRRDIPRFDTPIIETHCHLDYLDGDELARILEQSAQAGIERIITIAVSPDNLERVMQLTRAGSNIWGTQGIHPHEAEAYNEQVDAIIREHARDERILAVGEIGLDYYYDHADRAVQRAVFEQQLQTAADLDMPVVIHTREADQDTRDILQNFSGRLQRKGVWRRCSLNSSAYSVASRGGNAVCTAVARCGSMPRSDSISSSFNMALL